MSTFIWDKFRSSWLTNDLFTKLPESSKGFTSFDFIPISCQAKPAVDNGI